MEECAAGWKDRTDTVLKERSKARVVLEQHEKIRDLLDIPLLIDTCVRNGYFAEALSLVSHAKSLAANASTSNSSPPLILSSVLSEVHHSIMQMLLSLLSTLYEPNRKLPALWKAVNFLRKMDVFGPSSPFASAPPHLKAMQQSEAEKLMDAFGDAISNEEQISLAFLVGRESCLKGILEPAGGNVLRMINHGELDEREKEDLARYLKKYIDLWREGVYDVITQYSTIFLEGSSSSTLQAATTPTKSSASSNNTQEWIRLQTLITMYASRALSTHLLPALSSSLPFLSMTYLPSLLTQLTYCSTAFARVGLDFRGMLSTLFSHAVVEVITSEMRVIGEKFATRFRLPSDAERSASRMINGKPRPKWDQPSKWLITPATASLPPVPVTPATPGGAQSFHSPPHIPPQILASYPPLAEHTNALLSVLNGLRLLAPTDILQTLARALDEDVLSKEGAALYAYIKAFCADMDANSRARQASGGGGGGTSDEAESRMEKEKKIVLAFGQVFFGVFVPFMRRALVEGVYGVKLDDTFTSGESLPNVVMDWEDFYLAQDEAANSGAKDESDDDDEDEEEEDE